MSDAPIQPPAQIAFIGLGNMGLPMASRLVEAGYHVTGYDSTPQARERFVRQAKGAVSADLASAVRDAVIVITMLPDGKIVRGVVKEMRSVLRPHAIIIDMSSSDPVGTRTLGDEVIAAGLRFIDAPVSGGVKRALDGSLAIMVGGSAATIDAVEPVLLAMGKSAFRTGPLGSGHAMKALNNYVSGAGLVAAVEALRIGQAFGLDPNVMVDVLNASTGRNNSTEVKIKQFVLSETFASGFSIGLMAKDIRTADELAAAMGVPAPLADSTAALWDEACRALGSAADHTAIARYVKGHVG